MAIKCEQFQGGVEVSRCSNDPMLLLAAAVLRNAVADLAGDDGLMALDALIWLGIGDGPLFAEAVGLQVHPLDWIRELGSIDEIPIKPPKPTKPRKRKMGHVTQKREMGYANITI